MLSLLAELLNVAQSLVRPGHQETPMLTHLKESFHSLWAFYLHGFGILFLTVLMKDVGILPEIPNFFHV